MTMTMIQTQDAPDRLLDEAELTPRVVAVVDIIEQYIACHTALGWLERVERHETRLANIKLAYGEIRTATTMTTRNTARRNAQVLLIELEAAYRNAP